MGAFIDHSGQKFSRLTVVARAENSTNGDARWECRCDCGNTVTVRAAALRAKDTMSCGCMRREKGLTAFVTHGLSKHQAYRAWSRMRSRCNNPKDPSFRDYGGRGISISPEWDDFGAFFRDMGPAPPGTSLDRVNNSGGYGADNCRWATRAEQSRNTRAVKLSIEKARAIRSDTRPYIDISSEYGITKQMVGQIKLGRAWKELPTDTCPPAETYNK